MLLKSSSSKIYLIACKSQWSNPVCKWSTCIVLKTFVEDFNCRSLSPSELVRSSFRRKLFKNLPGTYGFADWQFFSNAILKSSYPRLKKTIFLYPIEKFEMVVVILTSGQKRVFFKDNFPILASAQSILY